MLFISLAVFRLSLRPELFSTSVQNCSRPNSISAAPPHRQLSVSGLLRTEVPPSPLKTRPFNVWTRPGHSQRCLTERQLERIPRRDKRQERAKSNMLQITIFPPLLCATFIKVCLEHFLRSSQVFQHYYSYNSYY
ncbi:hypothetical protein VTO42DRAFT_535 [Malbranchea cinnamomea]